MTNHAVALTWDSATSSMDGHGIGPKQEKHLKRRHQCSLLMVPHDTMFCDQPSKGTLHWAGNRTYAILPCKVGGLGV
jgi:hypothetical protein